MTPRQAILIQKSYAKIEARGKSAAKIFYDHLFRIAPDTRSLFPDDMEQQYHKFLSLLGTLISSLHRYEEFVPAIKELGSRHGGYHVADEHFGAVEDALIATLSDVIGADLTPEVQYAWTAGYWRLALIMQDTAFEARRKATA